MAQEGESLREILDGWQPAVDLEQGLGDTAAWYREHREWWQPIKSGAYLDYYRNQYAARLGMS